MGEVVSLDKYASRKLRLERVAANEAALRRIWAREMARLHAPSLLRARRRPPTPRPPLPLQLGAPQRPDDLLSAIRVARGATRLRPTRISSLRAAAVRPRSAERWGARVPRRAAGPGRRVVRAKLRDRLPYCGGRRPRPSHRRLVRSA